MSDPVTNVEIEDVLASIRRLVMEAAQPVVAETVTDGTAEASRSDVQGRLVLTPALRVVEPRAPLVGPRGTEPYEPTAEIIPALPDPDGLHPAGLVELEGSDVLPDATAAAIRAGRLEAAMMAPPGEWEPDGSEDEPVMDWSRTTPEDAPVFRSRHGMPLRLDRRVDVAEEPVEEPAFRHKPAVPEAVSPPRAPEAEQVVPVSVSEGLAAGAAPVVVDEELLRRVVTQVLQQELQGALGERITRNVRKLVRREINRALMGEQGS
jgi:hypothetical protein